MCSLGPCSAIKYIRCNNKPYSLVSIIFDLISRPTRFMILIKLTPHLHEAVLYRDCSAVYTGGGGTVYDNVIILIIINSVSLRAQLTGDFRYADTKVDTISSGSIVVRIRAIKNVFRRSNGL